MEETFEEWQDKNYGECNPVFNHAMKVVAKSAWNHQQQKITQRDERIAELEETLTERDNQLAQQVDEIKELEAKTLIDGHNTYKIKKLQERISGMGGWANFHNWVTKTSIKEAEEFHELEARTKRLAGCVVDTEIVCSHTLNHLVESYNFNKSKFDYGESGILLAKMLKKHAQTIKEAQKISL
jgi:flagellin-specific chaperone FliS